MRTYPPTRMPGITLVEVTIVLAIVAILSAVAWPVFDNYRSRISRADAIAALSMADANLERCGADNGGNYTNCVAGFPTPSPQGSYSVDIVLNGGGSGYDLTATKLADNDAECRHFTLDNLGKRGNTGPPAPTRSTKYCWSK